MKNYNNLSNEAKRIFAWEIIEELQHNALPSETISDRYGDLSELHHKCFNEDYFIIGCYQASEFIKKHFYDAFEAIEIVREYEQDNFGEFTTDVNPESICNMLAYIIGEEIIYSLDEDETIKNIIEELKNINKWKR